MITSERAKIEKAIAALEAQRELIGDAAVSTAIMTLQEQLARQYGATLDDPRRRTAERKQITTLFANITGLAGITDWQQDTELLDITKALWRRMDRAITEQGGMIDKHVADGVMGLFGVPIAHEDDPERAVRAALAARAVFSNFIADLTATENVGLATWRGQSGDDHLHPFQNLELRVGINTGPVLLGEVGTGEEYTVIGAAVNLASRLERLAPAGGILISHNTYLLVQGIFNVESLPRVEIKGIGEPVPVHLVLGMNPRSFHRAAWGVKGILTQLVGRGREIEQLQSAFQTALQTGRGRSIQVIGDAGVGKSRLIYEFSRWLDTRPEAIVPFKGRTDQQVSQLPYSLMRDMLATHFNIQDTDQVAAVEEKLTHGMESDMGLTEQEARGRAQAIGQFIGLSVVTDPLSQAAQFEAPQLQARVFDYLTELFAAIAASCDVLLLILEDFHWADPQSRQLIDHLTLLCQRAPMLIISLSRPQTVDETPGRTSTATQGTPGLSQLVIELPLLSAEESRRLVLDILRNAPDCPEELCDLIVSRADGNPFYVEEMIKVLIEDGVITTGEQEWRVLQNRMSTLRIPPTLTGVLQARIDRLSAMEKVTLQRAAVVGRLFWDSALIHIDEIVSNAMNASDVRVALNSLMKRELIFRRSKSGFANTDAYSFKHAFLRDVAYESVLLRDRPIYHRLAADWLAERSGTRIAEYAQLIAEHYEQAGEEVAAAELYEIAADRAREMYNPGVAIDYYQRAISLLQDKPLQAALSLTMHEKLGPLLSSQARLVEAIQVYRSMHQSAERDGDLGAQARANNGLAAIYREQADYAKMKQCAEQARKIAWLISADQELAQALLHIGDVNFHLGQYDEGLIATQEALELSLRLELAEKTSLTLHLQTLIHSESGNDIGVHHCLDLLEQQLSELEISPASPQMGALIRGILSNLYRRLGLLDQATFLGLKTLETYRMSDSQREIAETLCTLAKIAVWRGDPEAARPLYQEAISIANAIGDEYGVLMYRTQLAGVLNSLGEHQEAKHLLSLVMQVVADTTRFSQWVGSPVALGYLAEANLELAETPAALSLALQAHRQAQRLMEPILIAMTWRVLGKIAGRLSDQTATIAIGNQLFSAVDCFGESLRLLRQGNGNRHRLYREQVRVLLAWAAYERSHGSPEKASQLQEDATELRAQMSATAGQERIRSRAAADYRSPHITE